MPYRAEHGFHTADGGCHTALRIPYHLCEMDSIQPDGLMICNLCEVGDIQHLRADDIQGFRLDDIRGFAAMTYSLRLIWMGQGARSLNYIYR